MHDRSAAARAWRRATRFHHEHPIVTTLVLATLISCWVYSILLSHVLTVTPADPDSALFVWSMEHAPRQLFHARNPFRSDVIFATSGGANLAYNATAPLLGILMFPVTLLAGPVAALNVLTAITPVLNTLAARRLLRVISGTSGTSVTLGALIIGFSPMIMMHNGARLQLAFQAIGLLLLAEVSILARDHLAGHAPEPLRLIVVGALVGLQIWVGSEQLAIVAIVGVVLAVVTVFLTRAAGRPFVVSPSRRGLAAMAAGLGAMLFIAAPFLVAFLFGSERYKSGYHVVARPQFGLRVANLVTPTDATLLHSHLPFAVDRLRMSVFHDEDTGYVGLFALVALGLVAATWPRRSPVQRGALLVGAGCWLLALGPTVRWSGTGAGLPGPWRLIEHVPGLREIVANRMSLGMFVALGALVACVGHADATNGLPRTRRERWLRSACWCLPMLLIPAPDHRSRTVSSAAERVLEQRCHDALVVNEPQSLEQDAMAWQARSGFAFNLYRGFAFRSSSLPKGDRLLLDDIAEQGLGDDAAATAAVAEVGLAGITCVVSRATSAETIAHLIPVLGPPIVAGDVAVWPLS